MSVAGPLAHATTFVLAFWLAAVMHSNGFWTFNTQFCCMAQIATAILSLVPGEETDGGHVYRSLRRMPPHAKDLVLTRWFQYITSTVMLSLLVWPAFLHMRGLSLG